MSPWDRIHEALKDPRYTWRTIPRLATIAGFIPESDVLDILRAHSEVVFGRNGAGEAIVRLNTRTPGGQL